MEKKRINAGGNPVASYEAGYGVGNAISGHDPEVVSLLFVFRQTYSALYGGDGFEDQRDFTNRRDDGPR